MQICKSITAKQLFKQFPDLEEELCGSHFWSEDGHIDTDGYGVNEKTDYIKKQDVSNKQLKLYEFLLSELQS